MGAVDPVLNKAEQGFKEVVEKFKDEVATLRVGSADVEVVKNIMVEAYGSQMPLYQVATILAQSAVSMSITPWDKKLLEPIVEALSAKFKDITPTVKGDAVYLNFPPLTEEKKKEFLRFLSKVAEKYRQQLRDVRNDAKKELEALKKESQISDNEYYKAIEKLDALIRKYREEIEAVLQRKESQLLGA